MTKDSASSGSEVQIASKMQEIERLIRQILSDGRPQAPDVVIKRALDLGAVSIAKVRETIWWLLGQDVLQLTDQYELRRLR